MGRRLSRGQREAYALELQRFSKAFGERANWTPAVTKRAQTVQRLLQADAEHRAKREAARKARRLARGGAWVDGSEQMCYAEGVREVPAGGGASRTPRPHSRTSEPWEAAGSAVLTHPEQWRSLAAFGLSRERHPRRGGS